MVLCGEQVASRDDPSDVQQVAGLDILPTGEDITAHVQKFHLCHSIANVPLNVFSCRVWVWLELRVVTVKGNAGFIPLLTLRDDDVVELGVSAASRRQEPPDVSRVL